MLSKILTYEERRCLSRNIFGMKKKDKIYKDFIQDKQYIFIHIPKAAGKSVALKVYGNDKPGHYSVKDYIFYDKDKFKSSFVFTIVREPISRFCSAYNFLKTGGTCVGDRKFKDEVLDKYYDINDFVKSWVSKRNIQKKEHFIPQSYFLMNKEGKFAVDFIGKFESIQNDFNKICEVCNLEQGLEHTNKTTHNSSNELNEESLIKLHALYSEDFTNLGYFSEYRVK